MFVSPDPQFFPLLVVGLALGVPALARHLREWRAGRRRARSDSRPALAAKDLGHGEGRP